MPMEPSLAELYEENRAFLYAVCVEAVHDQERYHELIEDCIQETFTIAGTRWEELTHHPNVRGWLVRTCLNCLKARQRQYGIRQRVLGRWTTAQPCDGGAYPDAIEQYFQVKDMRAALGELIEAFSPEEKRLYTAYFVERQTMKSIAAREHMTENQVKNELKRIRKKARRALKEG